MILVAILILGYSFSFAQGQLLLSNNVPENQDCYFNGISFQTLFSPGKNFESISSLGEPLKTEYQKSFIDETYIRIYDGFQLTYVNLSGSPELYTLEMEGNSAQMHCADQNLINYSNLEKLLKAGLIKENSPEMTDIQRWDGGSVYIIFYTSDNEVTRAVLKCRLH